MAKKSLSSFVSVLLLTAAFVAVFNVKPAGALPFTVCIRADGSIEPPSANITTSDNITYTFTDHNFCGVQVERDNIVIDGAGYVLHGVYEGTIMDPNENDTLVGLNLTRRSNVTVQNLNVICFLTGIDLWGAVNCTVRGNTIDVDGPFMGATCINMLECANVTVVDNILRDAVTCIKLSASDNFILRNEFFNDIVGISLSNSSNNVVAGNSFEWTVFSLIIYDVSNDRFYHNNFYHRHHEMGKLDAANWTMVHWNESYAVGGNYWSDYVGADMYSGPYQNETGPDGIGDTPHVFAEGAAEMYPLMGPWTVAGEQVAVIDPSGVSVTFSNVTAEGITTINTGTPPDPPSGMKAVCCYNLRTEAGYSGKITVSLPYNDSTMTVDDERLLKLMQWNETSSTWVDITTGIGVRLDGTLLLNSASGETSSLSLFAVMWRLAGDINTDFTVDVYDAILLAGAFGSGPSQSNWNPNADLNNDEIVDIYDALILANNYGR